MVTKKELACAAISHTLFPPNSLKKVFELLGFVQIDPIKSPAPAQDLILRHRVKNYVLGDVDRNYKKLHLEEDFLYAHGYITQPIFQLLHPRTTIELTEFDKQVLDIVRQLPEVHTNTLEKYFEKKREVNWWGGYSRASKMSLERLHYYGLIRVAGRLRGQRIYQAFSPPTQEHLEEERLSKLILAIVHIMAPVSSKTLSASLHRIHEHFGNSRHIITKLVISGQLTEQVVEGVTYLWPEGGLGKREEVPQSVKFLAPFDPLVRDRVRFAHLWGWPYQFEAYVPAAKRIRGYYAMPILWESEMIGWVNIKRSKGEVDFDFGFVTSRPKDKKFKEELEIEMGRMRVFLQTN